MPLALQLLTRPVRVAGLVLLAGAVALLAGALALGAHPLALSMAPAVLVATGLVAGALAPLYGRGAAVGLWTARAGIAVGAVALVLPDSRPTAALRVVAALAALAGLRLVARGVRTGRRPPRVVVARRRGRHRGDAARPGARRRRRPRASPGSRSPPRSGSRTCRRQRPRRSAPDRPWVAQVEVPEDPRGGGAVRPPRLAERLQLERCRAQLEAAHATRGLLERDVPDGPYVGPPKRGEEVDVGRPGADAGQRDERARAPSSSSRHRRGRANRRGPPSTARGRTGSSGG